MTPESYTAWKSKARGPCLPTKRLRQYRGRPLLDPMPLATNVMTQPSGRVLSQPSGYRTYLRTSPIICFLDAFAPLLQVFSAPYFIHVPISRALKTTIRERYGDIKDEDASEGIQSLEKQTWLRWVFFVVGTLGPSIESMAMQGVPWTKVWGGMFLFAFLVIEAAAFPGKRSPMPSAYSSLPAISGQATRTTSERQVLRGFEALETYTFWYGCTAHCAVFVWAFFDLWILRVSAYDSVEKGVMASLVSLIFIVYLGNILICCPSLPVLALFVSFAEQDYPSRSYGRKWLNRACIGGLVVCAFGVISLGIYGIVEYRELVVDCLFFDLSLVCIPAVVFIIKKLCIMSPRLRDTLLVTSREESSSAVNGESLPSVDEVWSPVVDEAAVWSLTFCVANIILCLLWYWLYYESDRTVNPSWAGVFG